jgi:transcription elongation factor GreA
MVCPGCFVRVKNLDSGEESQFTILGPWDTDQGDDVISYRAPLAAGLLGRRQGEEAIADLPSGEARLEVLEVREAELAR